MPASNQSSHTYVQDGVTTGFFTDPTLCIGCKACEVACKEWNQLPADGFDWKGNSYDNTGSLGASTWRHVKFLELDQNIGPQDTGPDVAISWTFLSDVCKHCENAGCLEGCPTGSIFRTEVGSVYVQDDVCNGCGYCIVSCPFGVIDKRLPVDLTPIENAFADIPAEAKLGGLPEYSTGGAFKCTLCYDRQIDGMVPACAKTCPTESIQFGPLDELRERAQLRVQTLKDRGYEDVQLYDPSSVGGTHAFSLLPGNLVEQFGLPPNPQSPTVYLRDSWQSAALTIVLMFVLSLIAMH